MLSLPAELVLECLKYLKAPDLARLAAVSKSMNKLAVALLWSDISLQSLSRAEEAILSSMEYDDTGTSVETQFPSIARGIAARYPLMFRAAEMLQDPKASIQLLTSTFHHGFQEKAQILLQTLWTLRRSRPARFEELSKNIRSLSVNTHPGSYYNRTYRDQAESADYFNTIASLSRLEQLAITAEWDDHQPQPNLDGSHQPLQHLRELTLKYYVPIPVVRHFVSLPENLTHLDLFLLMKPISGRGRGHDRRHNHPDSEDEEGEDMDEAEAVAPRSLSWMPADLPARLTSLTHLRLRKPSQNFQEEDIDREYYHSESADQAALSEWATLIRGTRHRLVELLLEHMPTIDEIAMDAFDHSEHPVLDMDDPGDGRFQQYLLPALMEDAEWPSLKKLVLRQIAVNQAELRHRFAEYKDCEVVFEQGYFLFLNDETGTPDDGGMGNAK